MDLLDSGANHIDVELKLLPHLLFLVGAATVLGQFLAEQLLDLEEEL